MQLARFDINREISIRNKINNLKKQAMQRYQRTGKQQAICVGDINGVIKHYVIDLQKANKKEIFDIIPNPWLFDNSDSERNDKYVR